MRQTINVQTGEVTFTELTAEEIAERSLLDIPTRQNQEQSRAAAYRLEADPLFFKAQRGEATMDEWQAKIDEIRNRYPYS